MMPRLEIAHHPTEDVLRVEIHWPCGCVCGFAKTASLVKAYSPEHIKLSWRALMLTATLDYFATHDNLDEEERRTLASTLYDQQPVWTKAVESL